VFKNFASQGTEDIAYGFDTKAARKCLPNELHRSARRKLNILGTAGKLEDLKRPPGNHLEALKGDLVGFHSIRINAQWRIVFRWKENGPADIKICDYH
jgi:proteic killer suppression protein